jgi:hypothetical protein
MACDRQGTPITVEIFIRRVTFAFTDEDKLVLGSRVLDHEFVDISWYTSLF